MADQVVKQHTLNGPTGQTILGSSVITIGRAHDNQIVLNDPKVSRQHAQIRPDEQGYSIVDLGSVNGTFVNEQRLSPFVLHLLRMGDIIRIGDTKFTYQINDISTPTKASFGTGALSDK